MKKMSEAFYSCIQAFLENARRDVALWEKVSDVESRLLRGKFKMGGQAEYITRDIDKINKDMMKKQKDLLKKQEDLRREQEKAQKQQVRQMTNQSMPIKPMASIDSLVVEGMDDDVLVNNVAAFWGKGMPRKAVFMPPPKWLPKEMSEIWEYAVERADEEDVIKDKKTNKLNYPAVIKIYKNVVKKYTIPDEDIGEEAA